MNNVKQKEAPGVESRGQTEEMLNLSETNINPNPAIFQGLSGPSDERGSFPLRLSINHQKQNEKIATGFETVEINSEEEFTYWVRTSDHMPATLKDGRRRKESFQSCGFLFIDIDEGLTIEEFRQLADFVGVEYYLVTSRNHNKEKNGKPACERFHVFFPVDTISDPLELEGKLWAMAGKYSPTRYPFADAQSADISRFFFVNESALVIHNVGRQYTPPKPDFSPLMIEPAVSVHPKEPRLEKAQAVVSSDDFEKIRQGERNSTLASFAGVIRRAGGSQATILAALREVNIERCEPPMEDSELDTIARSIGRYPVGPQLREATNGQPKFQFVNVADLPLTPLKWIIKNLIPDEAHGELIGESGAGKSFVSVDIACCVGTGKPFHGHAVKRQGTVFYIAGEGFNGLTKRFRAWEKENDLELNTVFLSRRACQLLDTNDESIRSVIDAINELVTLHGKPALVILDTLARNFGDGDENSTADMSRAVNIIGDMVTDLGASVLVVHHTGLSDSSRGRGNSALKGGADFQFLLEAGATKRLTCIKMKDDKEPQDLGFQFKEIDLGIVDDDGEPVGSAVLVQVDAPPSSGERKENRQLYSDISTMRNEWSEANWTIAEDLPYVTRQSWEDAKVTLGHSKTPNAANTALKPSGKGQAARLIERGVIKVHEKGFLIIDPAISSVMLMQKTYEVAK